MSGEEVEQVREIAKRLEGCTVPDDYVGTIQSLSNIVCLSADLQVSHPSSFPMPWQWEKQKLPSTLRHLRSGSPAPPFSPRGAATSCNLHGNESFRSRGVFGWPDRPVFAEGFSSVLSLSGRDHPLMHQPDGE